MKLADYCCWSIISCFLLKTVSISKGIFRLEWPKVGLKNKGSDSSQGFTLVELLVVIAIIAVLATLLLLQLGVARAKARDAKRVADINQTRSALELYFDDNSQYLQTNVMTALRTGGYLVAIPADPLATGCLTDTFNGTAGGAAFCYGYAWNGVARYQVWAELEEPNANAFRSDTDADTTVGGWSGATAVGATETCASPTVRDCVFDLAQP